MRLSQRALRLAVVAAANGTAHMLRPSISKASGDGRNAVARTTTKDMNGDGGLTPRVARGSD